MRKILITVLILLLALPIWAQKTQILTADKHNEYGLVYTLPTTVVTMQAWATRTVNEAGPFWQYARKYIGTDDVIRESNEVWKLNNVVLGYKGVANTEKQYNMQFKPGVLTYIYVSDDNMLLAINKEYEFNTVRGVADNDESPDEDVPMNAYLEYVDGDFISSQSTAKQAEMLAQSLMEVRDAKVALTRGTAETMPTDGKQLELMLNSLARQEKAFMQAFTGKSKEESVYRNFEFTPMEEGKFILFRFSDFAGFVDEDNYAGDPVYIEVSNIELAELPTDEKGEKKKLPKDAVIYMIPGSANVAITFKGETIRESSAEYAQFGMEFGLQPSLFSDKRARSYAVFNPVTGALREIGEVNAE